MVAHAGRGGSGRRRLPRLRDLRHRLRARRLRAPALTLDRHRAMHDYRRSPPQARRAVGARVPRPRRPGDRPVGGPPPRAVHDQRIVVGHIDNGRRRGLHDDVLPLPLDVDLRVRLQVARGSRALPQLLHGFHHRRLLDDEGLAQRAHPVRVLLHALQKLREREQRLHARIPALAFRGAYRILARQPGVGARPARRLDHVQRGTGRRQHLQQQRVRVQRDRREHPVELGLRKAARDGRRRQGG